MTTKVSRMENCLFYLVSIILFFCSFFVILPWFPSANVHICKLLHLNIIEMWRFSGVVHFSLSLYFDLNLIILLNHFHFFFFFNFQIVFMQYFNIHKILTTIDWIRTDDWWPNDQNIYFAWKKFTTFWTLFFELKKEYIFARYAWIHFFEKWSD